MRPIKFRAWDKQHHEWLGADAWYVRDSSSVLVIWPEVKKGFQVSVNMETLGAERVEITQYTGLKDKNGDKEVYECDIIDTEGNIIGNQYETPTLLERKTNLLIQGFGTKDWLATYKEAVDRGCYDA